MGATPGLVPGTSPAKYCPYKLPVPAGHGGRPPEGLRAAAVKIKKIKKISGCADNKYQEAGRQPPGIVRAVGGYR